MAIISIFFLIVLVGGVLAFRLLQPYMYIKLTLPQFRFPWGGLRLLPDSSTQEPSKVQPVAVDHLPGAIGAPLQQEEEVLFTEKFNKMECLLLEKNKLIDRLLKELEAERSHRGEFDKVKSVMDAEILRLKEQIKTLKQQKEQVHA